MYKRIIILIFCFVSLSYFEIRADVFNKYSKDDLIKLKKESLKKYFSDCPSDITEIVTDACNASVSWTEPTSTDPEITITSTHEPGDTFAKGETTVTYTFTNTNTGVVTNCSFKVTVILDPDDIFIFPDVQCASNITVELLNSCGRTVGWKEPESPCPEIAFTKTALPNITKFDIGTTEVFYRANLDGVEVASCSFTVTLIDNIPPTFDTCPNNLSFYAEESCGAVATWTIPEAVDNCTDVDQEGNIIYAPILSSNYESGDIFPIGTTTVTYTATDAGGNTAECSFDVTVVDNKGPQFVNLPEEVSVSADENCEAIASWDEILAEDNCSNNIIINSNFNSGDVFPEGETIVEYSATDEADNETISTFRVIVEDNTVPGITNCPLNNSVNANSNCEAAVNWNVPTFTDNCDENLQITSTHDPGDIFPLGETEVIYTATDRAGNEAICSFIISVEDSTDPTIILQPNNFSVSAEDDACEAIVKWDAIAAEDNCSNSIEITTDVNSGDSFPLGETTVNITATDESENFATSFFIVTVEDDKGPVTIGCPNDITVATENNCESLASWTVPEFLDNCDTELDITSTHNPRDVFPLGTTTVTYTATDNAGNQSTCSFDIIVADDKAPEFTNCIADIRLDATDACQGIAEWSEPEAIDNCDDNVTLTSDFTSGDSFPLGTTLVTYTAKDEAGNTNTCSFNVIVEDSNGPSLSFCPENITLLVNSECNAIADWDEPIFEDCSNLSITSNYQLGDILPIGISTIEYTATDDKGLSAKCSFEVEVLDQTPPTIENCPANITIAANSNCEVVVEWEIPGATDNCSDVSIKSNFENGSIFPVGVNTVEYEFTDEAGNSSFCSFDVHVIDESELILSDCPEDISVQADNTSGTAIVSWEEPNATSECSEVLVNASHESGSAFDVGTSTVVYTFTKENGESVECSFDVTVNAIELNVIVNKLLTPNGDGNNDLWLIDGIEKFADNQVVIVDRWGTEIYKTTGYDNNQVVWNGENRNGELVSRGTYYYFISVRNEQEAIERKGFLEVLR